MFSAREKEVLQKSSIVVAYKFVAEYCFYVRVDGGAEQIRVKIEEDPDGRFHFSQSHYIQTPEQAKPYVTSRTFESTADAALDRAVDAITCHYDSAVRHGYTPKYNWFKRNMEF